MTERVKKILEILRSKEYKNNRTDEEIKVDNIESESKYEKFVSDLVKTLDAEKPMFIENDRIGFYVYHKKYPVEARCGNNNPNYSIFLEKGILGVYNELKAKEADADENQKEFIKYSLKILDAAIDYVERYRNVATGDLKEVLNNVPLNPPKSYHEALVMMKFLIYILRCDKVSHVTLGRFDQYMYPYYKMDVQRGMSHDELLELTEEFFLSINFDTDLYHGVQQGDNGQSMVLGGVDMNGESTFNELSMICMEASMELNLIDPKINLRVNKDTPMSLYRLGTKMTKLGLGFPQYCNDDIVIPGLISLGYTPEEAYDYAVAACWEFIVKDCYDIPNIRTMNFPKVINNVIHESLKSSENFDELMNRVFDGIKNECDELMDDCNKNSFLNPDPLFSLFIRPCLEKCTDYSELGANHYNFGFHGTGIANAADALSAVKKLVFEEKAVLADELLAALDADFVGYEELRNKLLACPKMGNNDDYVDDIANSIMKKFSEYLNGKPNLFGGIFRAGTGSAMEYILSSRTVPATADGRRAFTPFSSSFSPSITTNLNGPLSVIQSFTKYDLKKIINGGPLTIEIHDTTFRNEYGSEKVAQLVKMFIELGGHQLQLNSINREKLLDAQKNPELYPNLIVRVWGWSGYFNELDLPYQNHVISRTEFKM